MRRAVALAASVALAAALIAPGRPASAAEPVVVSPPVVSGLALDGVANEAGWAQAVPIPAESVDGLTPTVRAVLCAGSLWLHVEAAQDVGFPIGIRCMAAPEGTATAAEAVELRYAPQDVRGARFAVRGPRGVGRATYRLAGAADVSRRGAWSLEACVPLADLALPTDTTPLRLAVVVTTRVPNRIAAAPPGSVLKGPAEFAQVRPPAGGWSTAGVAAPDAAQLAKEDAADEVRLAAWRRFVDAQRGGAVSVEDARAKLLAPLEEGSAARPDLASLHVLRASLLRQLDDGAGSRKALEDALRAVPHLPEASWGLAELEIEAITRPAATEPSDYDAAFARIAELAKAQGADAPVVLGAEGILRYRHGDFARAVELLGPLSARYPVDEETAGILRFARLYGPLAPEEEAFRKADAAKGDLPRVRLVTSRGPVLLELFEDETPNTVRNFLWLAAAKAYDGTTFHRVEPFFMCQGGDPLSRKADPRVGAGGPGYAIRTEPGKRRPFRGMVAMANAGPDTEGSQFFVTTGTAAHLEGKFSVFGRVLEGQEVVDRIVKGDRIEAVDVVRKRDHEYRPTTVAGTPAPEPARPK